MSHTLKFIVIVFVLVVAIVCLTGTIADSILILSLLANLLIISSQLKEHHKSIVAELGLVDDPVPAESPVVASAQIVSVDPSTAEDIQAVKAYNESAMSTYNSYKYTPNFPEITPCSVNEPGRACEGGVSNTARGFDAMNALMAQRRARDKQAMDGWAVKDANYYRHHYGDELEKSEAKVWWGANEI